MAILKAYTGPNGQAMAPPFRDATRRRSVRGGTLTHAAFGSTQSLRLPKTGLLAGLRLRFSASIPVATPGGNFPTWPLSPFNLFSRIRLYTPSVNIFNLSGYSLYLLNVLDSAGYVNQLATSVGAATIGSALVAPASGAVGTTNTIAGVLYLYPMVSQNDMRGIHPLQTPNVDTSLDITMGSASDIMGASTGTVGALSMTTTVSMDVFELPADPASQPLAELSWERQVNDFAGTVPVAGGVTVTPIQIGGPIYNRILGYGVNNAALMTATDIQTLLLQYAGRTVSIFDEDYYDRQEAIRRETGLWLPNGVFAYNLVDGVGVPKIFDERDLIDTRQLSDLSLGIGYNSGTSMVSPSQTIVQDYFLPRAG